MRTIHTGLYSAKAYFAIQRLRDYCRNHWSTQMARNWGYATLKRDFDGEIVLTDINEASWRYHRTIFCKWPNDQDIRNWIANSLKTVCMSRASAAPETCNLVFKKDLWLRDCKTVAPWFRYTNTSFGYNSCVNENDPRFDLTMKELYCIYEILKGRTNLDKKYGDLYEELKGEQYDPMRAEQARVIAEEIVKIRKEAAYVRSTLSDQRCEKERRMRDEIYAWYNEEMKKNEEAEAAKIKELQDAFAFIEQMS